MAYPFNYPAYSPMYPYYQPTNAYPTQQSVVPTQPTQSGIIWVSGAQEASMYPIAPNNAVTLWDKSGKTVYVKQADATGKPTITVYDLVERIETASDGSSASGDKVPVYATKDELSAVLSVVKGFDSLISGMKSDIEKMSGDLYGIAGKKRAVKKPAEVTEDDE